MGHVRLGKLLKTKPWKKVISLIANGADAAQVANATVVASEKALAFVQEDTGFKEAVHLMVQLGLHSVGFWVKGGALRVTSSLFTLSLPLPFASVKSEDVPPHRPAPHRPADALRAHLKAPVARRYSGGQDIHAACGMLAGLCTTCPRAVRD